MLTGQALLVGLSNTPAKPRSDDQSDGTMARVLPAFVSVMSEACVSLYHGQLRCTRVSKHSLALTVAVQPAATSLLPVGFRVGSSART